MRPYPHTITITVVRPGGEDQFGDPLPGTEHTVSDVIRFPRTSSAGSSNEHEDFSDTVVTGYTLLPPQGADLLPTDRVRLPGDPPDSAPWQVLGELVDWGPSPFTGWNPGMQVAITKSTG